VTRTAVRLILAAQVVRHTVVLANVVASVRFLSSPPAGRRAGHGPRIAVVLPMLREQAVIAQAVDHFRSMLREGDVLLLVTTARESGDSAREPTTPVIAAGLADDEQVRHLHLRDRLGRKGDQINLAARMLARWQSPDRHADWLIVVYDADSRPPNGSLSAFAEAATHHPDVHVFHQSARFEVRGTHLCRFERAAAHAGALRANRFVLAYELPRLRSRAPRASQIRRRTAALTYGHISGHGLALRLPFLRDRPMPSRTDMEDMRYSFGLAADRVAVMPLSCLDCSEVPAPWSAQFRQAERWFSGPGRALAYAHERRAARRGGGYAVTVSALLISLEWLSCALAVPMLAWLLTRRGLERRLAIAFLGLYGAQLTICDRQAGPTSPADRAAALLTFPLINTGFGLAGWSALLGSALGWQPAEKTER
jgi:hypothetical protein